MEFMTVKQAAEKWGLSERRLQTICNEGMIPGVVKFGKAWAISMDAERPEDKRIKSGKSGKSRNQEIKKSRNIYKYHILDIIFARLR